MSARHASHRPLSHRRAPLAAMLAALAVLPSAVRATCPEEPPVQNHTGGGQTVCPCFIAGEEAGSVLLAPVAHYPIEILRVGIGWGSQFGGSPQQQEAAVNVYGAGLPNPGAPISSLPGPVLSDGFINEYNLEPLAGEIVVSSGPFTVTLEFLNENAGNFFAPSVVHDGNGCQPGKNVIFAIPGGWMDGCAAGLSGDWVFYAVYRPVNCTTGAGEEIVAQSNVPALLPPLPNPFEDATRVSFVLPAPGDVSVAVFDVAGRKIADLASGAFGTGAHTAAWNGMDASGKAVAAGSYFVRMISGSTSETRRVLRIK